MIRVPVREPNRSRSGARADAVCRTAYDERSTLNAETTKQRNAAVLACHNVVMTTTIGSC